MILHKTNGVRSKCVKTHTHKIKRTCKLIFIQHLLEVLVCILALPVDAICFLNSTSYIQKRIKMAKSSMNSQPASSASGGHTEAEMMRAFLPEYLLERAKNFSGNRYKDYGVNPQDYLEKAKVMAKEKTGRKMQTKAIENFLLDSVINLEKHHTIKDLEKVFENLNKRFGGFKVFKMAIHQDEGVFIDTKYSVEDLEYDSKNLKWYKEGEEVTLEVIDYAPNRNIFYNQVDNNWYFDKTFSDKADVGKFQKHINYHAHVQYTKFNMELGKNPRLRKAEMSELQTIVADALKMERGEVWSKRRRQTHWQRKEAHDMHREIVAKLKDELKTKLLDMQEKLDKKGKVSKVDLTELKEIHRQQMIKAEEVYTPEQYQSLNALYKQAIEENKAKEFDLAKFEYSVEQLKHANELLEENLEESIEEAYLVEESWNPDIEGVSKREYLYKDLYASEKEENEKLEEGISEREKYIRELEEGYSKMETHIFGKDEARSIESIVEKVSVLQGMVNKFVNLLEYIKDKIPFVSDMFSLVDKELIKDAIETTKQAQKPLEEENTSKDTSKTPKDVTSDSKQFHKFKKTRP